MSTVPSYTNGGWIDDPVVPNWQLRRSDGFTSILLLMNSFTFSCSGRLSMWYLWWRVNNPVGGCEVTYTLHVLRNSGRCGPMQVGSQQIVRRFYDGDPGIIAREVEVIPADQEIIVRAGDFIGVQIDIGIECSYSTVAWLRGKISTNTVLYQRRQDENYFTCTQPYTVLNNGLGFISASVGEFY